MSEIIVLDTETSGLGEQGRILELAYIHEHGNKQTYHRTLSKVANITPEAMATHHITPEMLEGEMELGETICYQFLDKELNKSGNFIVAHNATFDINMLMKEGFRNKMQVIDTLRIVRNVLPNLKFHNLQYLRYYLGIYKQEKEWIKKLNMEETIAHTALGDVLVTYILFDRLRTKYGIDKLIEISNTILTDMTLNFGKYKGQKISEVAKTDKSYLKWLADKSTDEEVKRIAELNL